ncbi:MAG: hypothetical protein ABF913_07830 [Oenococcus sp.]|uniref:hypothetical protein n=1 Tax=Oenococcus sp. TaxID=1979414 RepID=UPI0039EB875A
MNLIIKKVSAVATSFFVGSLLLAGVANRSTSADVPPESSNIYTNASAQEATVNTANQYVTVKNNRYILNLPVGTGFTDQQITMVQDMINKANDTVSSQNLIINPITKTSSIRSNVLGISLRAASNGRYTFTNFWWGTRYYMRSNAAVEQLAHEFTGYAQVLTAGAAGVVAGAGALFYNNMASNIRYYNSTHSKNQIYMDFSWSGIYSLHVLK